MTKCVCRSVRILRVISCGIVFSKFSRLPEPGLGSLASLGISICFNLWQLANKHRLGKEFLPPSTLSKEPSLTYWHTNIELHRKTAGSKL